MNSELKHISNATSGFVKAGELLSEQRQKQGLSIAECAESLKITSAKIVALEAGDKLPFTSEMFIRGYLKNYAKLLGLSVNDVIGCYNLDEKFAEADGNFDSPNKKQSTSSGRWWLPYLVGFIVVILWFLITTYWDFEKGGFKKFPLVDTPTVEHIQDSPASNLVIVESNESLPQDINIASLQEENALIVNVNETLPSNSLPQQGLPETLEAVELPEMTHLPEESLEPEAVSELDVSVTTVEELQPQISESDSVSELVASATQNGGNDQFPSGSFVEGSAPEIQGVQTETTSDRTTVIAAGSDLLHFTFAENCWVEVTDANTNIISTGLRYAGTELFLKGQAPFTIVLGNINGTELHFNGEAITLANSLGGRTLRLIVGG